VRLILFHGIYYIDKTIRIRSKGHFNNLNRLSIEALCLPDDEEWKPELMPVLLTLAKPDTNFDFFCTVGLMVDMEHISIKGLKFTGHPYPQIPCYPIGRENAEYTDLEVSQCVFVGNTDVSYIQVGVLTNGSSTIIDHCVFYNCGNAAVFWHSDNGKKQNNGIKYSIIYGAKEAAIWASDADTGFIFHHNIITKCTYAFVKNFYNKASYSLSSSIITENQNYTGIWTESGLVPENYVINENKVIKEGEINLVDVKVGEYFIDKRYLHPIQGTLGFEIGAGLFKK
jgi:hypothetical protein